MYSVLDSVFFEVQKRFGIQTVYNNKRDILLSVCYSMRSTVLRTSKSQSYAEIIEDELQYSITSLIQIRVLRTIG